jgi:hypothetical protein
VGDGFNFLHERYRVLGNSLGFIRHHQPPLELGIMGSDAGWTGILVALQGLNATKGQHETPGGHCNVGSGAKRPSHLPRIRQLTAGDDPNTIPQAVANQDILNKMQTFL